MILESWDGGAHQAVCTAGNLLLLLTLPFPLFRSFFLSQINKIVKKKMNFFSVVVNNSSGKPGRNHVFKEPFVFILGTLDVDFCSYLFSRLLLLPLCSLQSSLFLISLPCSSFLHLFYLLSLL